MSTDIELAIQSREVVGKGASRRLRREQDIIPAIVYGAGKKPQMISIEHNTLLHALDDETFYSSIVTLVEGKKKQKAILKDLQRHPYKPKLIHADFMRIDEKSEMTVSVPLQFEGDAPGVKDGGIMTPLLTEIEIVCMPADLPTHIVVDIAELELNASIHLAEIKAPEGVQFTATLHDEEANPLVVSIQEPKVVEEPEVAEGEEAAEGEEGATEEGSANASSDEDSSDDAAEDKDAE